MSDNINQVAMPPRVPQVKGATQWCKVALHSNMNTTVGHKGSVLPHNVTLVLDNCFGFWYAIEIGLGCLSQWLSHTMVVSHNGLVEVN